MNKERAAWAKSEKQTDRVRRCWFLPQRAGALATTLAAVATVGGCATLGPPTLHEARTNYNEAVADTQLKQVLMNIVRVHNNEDPLFMEVSQINDVSSLSMNPSGAITGFWSKAGPAASLNGAATYTQNPTIQLAPLQGQQLIQQISTPITTDTMASLYNSNWPILNILDFAAQRVTPGIEDQSAALNRITALQDLQSVDFASTISDLNNKATPPTKAASTSQSGGSEQVKLADALSLYFLSKRSLADDALNHSKDTEMARKLWYSLRAFYRGTQPETGLSNRIELRVVPRSSHGQSSEADLSPVLSTHSAFGALKSALEGGQGALIAFVSSDDYRNIRSSPLNNWQDVVSSNVVSVQCNSGVFYTLTFEQAVRLKNVTSLDNPKSCDRQNTESFVQKSVCELRTALDKVTQQQLCPYSVMALTGATSVGAETLLDALREFILVIEGETPPSDAFTYWNERGHWYYIARDDYVSQRNLMLLDQILTIQSTATPPPSTTAIVVQ
jgi:hypothetical protein